MEGNNVLRPTAHQALRAELLGQALASGNALGTDEIASDLDTICLVADLIEISIEISYNVGSIR